MAVDLKRYIPRYFYESPEMNIIAETEEKLYDETLIFELNNTKANQFIITATETGIQAFEYIIGVVANPQIETLEFRRQRLLNRFALRVPLTAVMLRKRLDSIIGKGKYTLTIDYANYMITLESSAQNQAWFNEIYITVLDIKPANMIFINKPLLFEGIKLNENISLSRIEYNYRLGTTAKISEITPLASVQDLGIIKGGDIMSAQAGIFEDLAIYIASQINKVVINGTYEITTFSNKLADGNNSIIEYTIPQNSGLNVVTDIKLYGQNNKLYFKDTPYIPLTTDQMMKHNIPIKEGV